MPRVSVCIPCYNGADLLPRSIESVLSQDYDDYEVIVLNDGSKDNSEEVAKSYAGVRVITKENGGVSLARQVMLEEAKGELIAFLDHDDEWLPGKLRKSIEFFDQTGADFVHTDGYFLYEDGSTHLRYWRQHDKAKTSWDHLLPACATIISSVVFRRDQMLSVGGFEPGLKNCSEWRAFFRLAPVAKFAYLNEPLVNYFVIEGSLSHYGLRFFEREVEMLTTRIEPDLDRLVANETPAEQKRIRRMLKESIGLSYARMFHMCWTQGERGRSMQFAKKALSNGASSELVWRRMAAALLGRK